MDNLPEITKHGLEGFYGIFEQNSSINVGSDQMLAMVGRIVQFQEKLRDENYTDNEVRFVAINSPPHSFVNLNKTHFSLWGPLFTLMVETVKYLNYR